MHGRKEVQHHDRDSSAHMLEFAAMSAEINSPAANLARVRERIERAASRAGRTSEDITLIAVSKFHPAGRIRELYDAGVRHFGENRVQEWETKRAILADLDATWHLIGHLQSNKAARAVRLFHAIDSVDSIALAERLQKAKKDFNTEGTESAEKGGEEKSVAREMRLRVLLEVRLDPAAAKSGVSEDELPRLMETVLQLQHLDLRGLMGVPPYFEDPEKVRPFFRHLRELRDTLHSKFGGEILPVLSMGMSHDFEIAIEEGATEIRVGTALFGERSKV
jgi:pyridoxal phosphate enzyme (YggS family)